MDRDGPWETRVVSGDEAGMRLDAFVAAAVPGLSARSARSLVERGLVLLDGRPGRKGERLAAGSRIDILERPVVGAWLPEPDERVPFRVVLEDPHLLVVDKPSGVPSVDVPPPPPQPTIRKAISNKKSAFFIVPYSFRCISCKLLKQQVRIGYGSIKDRLHPRDRGDGK